MGSVCYALFVEEFMNGEAVIAAEQREPLSREIKSALGSTSVQTTRDSGSRYSLIMV